MKSAVQNIFIEMIFSHLVTHGNHSILITNMTLGYQATKKHLQVFGLVEHLGHSSGKLLPHLEFPPQLAFITSDTVHDSGDVSEMHPKFFLKLERKDTR